PVLVGVDRKSYHLGNNLPKQFRFAAWVANKSTGNGTTNSIQNTFLPTYGHTSSAVVICVISDSAKRKLFQFRLNGTEYTSYCINSGLRRKRLSAVRLRD